MKKLKQLTMVFVMIVAPAASAFAGDIWIDKAPPPPPPASSSTTATGEMPAPIAGEIQTESVSSDSVAAVALNLMQIVLAAF